MKKLFLIILLFIVSCTNFSTKNLLLESNCAPPCWNGIIPGETSKEQVLTILSDLSIVDQIESTGAWNSFDDGVIFKLNGQTFIQNNRSIYVETRLISDRVVVMNFTGRLDVTLGEMINMLEEPNTILIQDNPFGGQWISGILPARGVAFGCATMEIDDPSRADIKPDIDLNWVTYFSPSHYADLQEASWFLMGNDNIQIEEILYKWVGYGNLQEKYFSQK